MRATAPLPCFCRSCDNSAYMRSDIITSLFRSFLWLLGCRPEYHRDKNRTTKTRNTCNRQGTFRQEILFFLLANEKTGHSVMLLLVIYNLCKLTDGIGKHGASAPAPAIQQLTKNIHEYIYKRRTRMKRIALFLVTNFAVLLVLSFSARLLGVDRFLAGNGLDMGMLLGFAALIGFGGSFISLLMSKTMAKMSTGARVIERPQNQDEAWLVDTVRQLSKKADLPMPEVAIYDGAPNAFATGASKSKSLVAVSTGLLQGMNKQQVEAVLAHEVSHIQNGDMVTLTLIQGVVNTFVIFLARAVAYVVDSFLRGDEEESGGPGIGYWVSSIVLEIMFGILASIVVMYFSRQREYRADAGAAALMGNQAPMIDALRALGNLQPGQLPKQMAASGIAGSGMKALFSSHPPIESRIAALESAK